MIVKYVGYYDISSNEKENRKYSLAGSNKMSYICSAIKHTDNSVEVISTASTTNRKFCLGKNVEIDKKCILKLPFSIGEANLFVKALDRVIVKVQLLIQLIFMTKRNENVIVYHSASYMKAILIAKLIKKFRLILEIEEIYGDVYGSVALATREMKFFRFADAYIFPTELLNKKVNTIGKPQIIIHGTYQVEVNRESMFNDNKIHCVYAGTFEPRKGCSNAVAAAKYLDARYHIHIIGFGSDDEKKILLDKIEKTSKITECMITYDGLFNGEDYIKFIQSCHIGLSTQNPNSDFINTSFPSKVLSYLANGLRVVSIKLNALKTSKINDLIFYYEEDTPEAIAEAIKKVDFTKNYDSVTRIKDLDYQFIDEIDNMLKIK